MHAIINGIPCMFYYEQRFVAGQNPVQYPYMYQIRHDEDDWSLPISIEWFVAANFYGTIFTSEPITFDAGGYIEITQFDMERNLTTLSIPGVVFLDAVGLPW